MRQLLSRQLLSRHRRTVSALLAAASAAFGLAAARAHPDDVPVLVAARDLPGGTTLRPGDVAVRTLPRRAVPDGAVRRAAGRSLSGPVRRGEPLTDARLRSAGLLDDRAPDAVATPVRLADPAVARLLHAGDRVDVLAARAEVPLPARTIAARVPVITVPRPDPGADEGALIVLRTGREQAAMLARAAVDSRLSVVIVG